MSGGSGGGSGSVFVAEDDQPMRALLELVVRRAGYEAIGCDSGVQLLQRLREAVDDGVEPALVVSDNRMPGRSGLEVLEAIRGWGLTTPFVLLTAFPDDELLRRAHRSSADDVVSKPVTLELLASLIDRHIRRRHDSSPCAVCGEAIVGSCCEVCEPTGRYRVADVEDGYLDLGGSD